MSVGPFDHPVLSGLFGDPEVAGHLSLEADLAAMARFEVALANAQAAEGLVSGEAAAAIEVACRQFTPDIAALRQGVARDGVIVPEWLRQLRASLDPAHSDALHFGATSQDVIDTSLVLRLAAVIDLFDARVARLIGQLDRLADRFGTRTLMARTRMQDALAITVADRLADWRLPLARHRAHLGRVRADLLVVQLGGAVGDRQKLEPNAAAIAERMARDLGLGTAEKAWHSQRDGVFGLAAWLAAVSGALGKTGQDVALMALAGPDHIRLSGGGGSSAMPHKTNPVAAETLVSLSRHNSALVGSMGQALVAEQERSGAAWTLEWLTLPQMVATTGSGLVLAARLLDSVQTLGADA